MYLILTFAAFAFILSMVPFSVAVNSSLYRCIEWKESLRIAVVFAIFEAAMLMTGWLIGFGVKGLLHSMAVPVAVLIILFIGIRFVFDAQRLGRGLRIIVEENNRILLSFAFVISINTLLLGLGIGILYPKIILLAGLLFGMVFLMTLAGIFAGKRGMMNIGKVAETAGGLFLFLISAVIILQYLKIF